MGWDAYACRDNVDLDVDYHNFAPGTEAELRDPSLKAAFEAAAKKVADVAGCHDGLLQLGALDVSTAGSALSEATGRSVYDEDGWSPDEVKQLLACADWSIWDHREQDRWAMLSAKAFLETCAAHGLGVRFSY